MWDALFATDFFDQIMRQAQHEIAKDRARFLPIREFLLEVLQDPSKYTKTNADRTAVAVFYVSDSAWNVKPDSPLHVYCPFPFDFGRVLTRVLCDRFDDEIALKKVIADHLYRIEYDDRVMCDIHYVQDLTSVYYAIDPQKPPPGPPRMPLLLELTYALRKLSSVEYLEEWEDLYTVIPSILDRLKLPKSHTVAADHPSSTLKHEMIDFFYEKDYVLLSLDKDQPYNIEVISQNEPEYDLQLLQHYFQGRQLTWKRKQVMLPNDMRFEKLAVYVAGEPALSLYFSGRYDLVPYALQKGYQVADPIVQCRFAAINMIVALGMPEQPEVRRYIEYMGARLARLAPSIEIWSKKKLYGVFESDAVYKKIMAIQRQSQERHVTFCKTA